MPTIYLFSPVFLYITIKSKSVIAASVMHGTINALGVLTLIMVKGGTDLTISLSGFAGFIALFIVVTAFVV